ncbi:MAG: SLATT domain-containing protein [Methylococcaceae bacterium]|nr:SLATT domain-containing protein [Methylococcaceae bacterium]
MEISPQVKVLEVQIKKCYVWTHIAHEQCATLVNSKCSRIKLLMIIVALAGVILAGVAVGTGNKAASIASLVSSVAVLAMSVYIKRYTLIGASQNHAQATSSIWNVHEKYLSLLTDMRAGIADVDEIRNTREKLQYDLHKAYRSSPETLTSVYDETTKTIKDMEKLPDCDEQFDKFLPENLRGNSGGDDYGLNGSH